MSTQQEELVALVLQIKTCLAEAGFGEGLTLMERLEALVQAHQQAQGLRDEAQEALREAYTAVAMAFPGRKEIGPEVPLAEHIQALADACYQQGYEAGKAWGRGVNDVAAAWLRGQVAAPGGPPCKEEGASPCAYAQRVGADLQATAERARRLTIEVADLRGTVRALQAELRGALAALTCRDRR
jgi:hypothetical protein